MPFLTSMVLAALFLGPVNAAIAAPAGPGAGGQDFRADARSAGLTAAEADELQKRVDARLDQLGGKQVAANKIEYAPGSHLLLNLPGEKYARELNQPIGTLASCAELYFCAWSGGGWSGEKRSEWRCSVWIHIPTWAGYGSWMNTQTPGTRAYFLGADGSELGRSSAAPSHNSNYVWTPVYHIDPC
ncbi:hypothetical protein [Micromonospora sp. NPDC004704]